MADLIKVDTANVVACAKNIADYNNKIRDDFSVVESVIKALENVWNSSAATNAMGSYRGIKSAYYDERYTVVNNFVNFLHQQIDPGYTQTETANTSLADSFK